MTGEGASRFSYGKILVIGSGFFALMLVWTVYNTYMPLILGEFISSSAIRGAIMGLDNLLAILLIPVIGAWSDRVQTRLGQRLPFIIVGMPLAALFFILLPFGTAALWILLALDVVFLLAMTLYRAPVIALMPDHTPPEKRSSANGVINLMGGIGAIIALFGLAQLFDVNQSLPFIIAGGLMLLAFILLFFTVDRNPPYAAQTAKDNDEVMAVQSAREGFKQILQPEHRGKLLILIAIFIYFIGYTGVEAQFSIYATEHLGASGSEAGLTLGFFSLAFVLFALPAGLIGNKLGKTGTMMIGLLTAPVLFLLIPFFESLLVIKILLFIVGLAWALVNVQAYPLVADLGGLTKIGLFTGLYYLFSMASAIVAPALLGLFMDVLGYPSLFIAAAITFVIAYFFLREGQRRLQSQE
ncbi:MFS transporter [Bacillus horti]|uniref:MFS family permease n=1 Tax=Caldalkalibacillus horti TaxID=77523 RepID=A0ABT9VZ68_9BACI|nr:MFS transporter [Bacillus horti]MDQ0166297.1 MFS family permease [Bacillus horti]